MSKMTPFNPIRYNPNKKIERLYFPQYGDSQLFAECGKKHFHVQSAFKTPYASYVDEEGLKQSQPSKVIKIENVAPKQSQYQSSQYRQINERLNLLTQRQQSYNQRDVLDQQMERIYGPQRDSLESLQKKELSRNQRIKTQIEDYRPQQMIYPQQSTPSEISRPLRQRIRTEQTQEPQPVTRNRARFNPTFLSSINY